MLINIKTISLSYLSLALHKCTFSFHVAILLAGDPSLLWDSQSRLRHVESPNTVSSLAFAAIFEQLGTLKAFSSRAHSWFFILHVQDLLQLLAGPPKYLRLDSATQLSQLVANLSSFSISCLITFTLMIYQFLFIFIGLQPPVCCWWYLPLLWWFVTRAGGISRLVVPSRYHPVNKSGEQILLRSLHHRVYTKTCFFCRLPWNFTMAW